MFAAERAKVSRIALLGAGRCGRAQSLALRMDMCDNAKCPFLRGGQVALIGLHISAVFQNAACNFQCLAAALGNKAVSSVVVRQHAPKLTVAVIGSILRNIGAGDAFSVLNRQVFAGLHIHNGVIAVLGLLQIQVLILSVVYGINLRIGTVRHGFSFGTGCNV